MRMSQAPAKLRKAELRQRKQEVQGLSARRGLACLKNRKATRDPGWVSYEEAKNVWDEAGPCRQRSLDFVIRATGNQRRVLIRGMT